jgi:hypothetical protein
MEDKCAYGSIIINWRLEVCCENVGRNYVEQGPARVVVKTIVHIWLSENVGNFYTSYTALQAFRERGCTI